MAKMPTMDEWAERIGNKTINEFVYNGRTLKEWIDLMASGYCVVLPDGATNGDVIKALFPNEGDFETDFDTEWWDAPYKAGDI